jgi:cytochrome c biogenesis protein CcdA
MEHIFWFMYIMCALGTFIGVWTADKDKPSISAFMAAFIIGLLFPAMLIAAYANKVFSKEEGR